KIRFICEDGATVKNAIEQTIRTGEGQTFILTAEGFDEQGDTVSKFEYEWSVKVKNQNAS
ncbi:MAG: thioesterase, partial [Flavobacteriaceae bacterium]|nr:thioesterase [Flavobacteriaceae bacterium]